ncbi:MAG: fused response regulator/phosphatase [Spirochaetia bacterium]|nr:fused response regulator/phosphatase [Spirochaetia bacterium]
MNYETAQGHPEILVVEPDHPTASLLRETFTKMQYPVHMCSSGEEAIKYLETEASPVIFLSADLPGISGLETLHLVQSMQFQCQIIFLLGEQDVREMMHSISGRIPNFLFRPFSEELLQIAARKAEQNYKIEKEKWLYQEAIQRDVRIASRIQKQIMAPDLSPLQGVWHTGAIKPAHELSGNFCQFFHLGQNRIMVLVGDISGSGITASMIAHEVVHEAHLQSRDCPSAGGLLGALNRSVIDRLGNVSLTALCAVLDTERKSLEFASAGGPLPFRVRKDGFHEILVQPGQVMGILKSMEFPSRTVQLEEGDGVFFYTDGLLGLGMGQQGAMDEIFLSMFRQLSATAAGGKREDFDAVFQRIVSGIGQRGALTDDLSLAVTLLV